MLTCQNARRSFRTTWSAAGPTLLAFLLTGSVAAAQARLEHSAPWLGRTLALEVTGAPPNQLLELYYSDARDAHPTPFGVLELQRGTTRRLDFRTSDATGHAAFQLPVPLSAALADDEAHFQVLVTDPSSPAGKAFTNASHLRLLGTRIYAHERSRFPDPPRGGLEIIDAVHGVVSEQLDFGSIEDVDLTNQEGKPVFSANFDLGAVMASSTRLVFFDPFFGTTRAEVSLRASSRTLWTDAQRERVYVLQKGTTTPPAQVGRLHVFDLRTGLETATLDLPEPASGAWCTSDDQATAFIASYEASSGAAILRRVSLAPLAVGDWIALGTTLPVFDQIQYAAGQVFVASHEPTVSLYGSAWTRVAVSSASMSAVIQTSTITWFPRCAIVPALDRILLSRKWITLPASGLLEEPLATGGPWMPVSPPGGYLSCDDMVPEGNGVWILDSNGNGPPGNDEPGRLYRIDLTTQLWRQYPRSWPFEGPRDLDIVHDALCDQIVLACRYVPPPIGIQPVVFVFDRQLGVERTIPALHSPESLLAVPVP